jgi:hypothetical protein
MFGVICWYHENMNGHKKNTFGVGGVFVKKLRSANFPIPFRSSLEIGEVPELFGSRAPALEGQDN